MAMAPEAWFRKGRRDAVALDVPPFTSTARGGRKGAGRRGRPGGLYGPRRLCRRVNASPGCQSGRAPAVRHAVTNTDRWRPTVKLYQANASPFSSRVRICLYAKGLDVEIPEKLPGGSLGSDAYRA